MNIVLFKVLEGVNWALTAAYYLIIIRAILSWFMRPDQPIYAMIIRITEPMIAPFRPLAYRLTNGRLPRDLAPLFAFFAIHILQQLLYKLMAYLI